jgi:endoglucanase
VIQTARAGVATALLGIPLRYMHSAVETVDPSDVEALARLICGTLKGCDFDA